MDRAQGEVMSMFFRNSKISGERKLRMDEHFQTLALKINSVHSPLWGLNERVNYTYNIRLQFKSTGT